ncbi:unnamed protein product [Caenorhabditis bovis]|uniref:FACT complex subunit SSRP1 n=1 Tax=Caenorhabditis bovis TaxID=2654633 RepID=A0A8S1EKQ4_9PELO|nr:unnamed protein product [Caenorhabditis bovis]
MSQLEFSNIFIEDTGILENGFIRFTDSGLQFKNNKTGKVSNIASDEIDDLRWQRLGNKPGLRVGLNDGDCVRFGGFKDTDFEQVKSFTSQNWSKNLEQVEMVLKGWNYGNCKVKGKSVEFSWEDKPIFEIPCSNVSQCIGNKNEATLEFHQNDDCPVSLMEMRFHMPINDEEEDHDPVEEFKRAVLEFAGLETETGQAIATLQEILCTTPRGRYDIKIYPNHLSLHGKTYDYKIPIKTITRLFLVPHKDGRHVYFVISLNPPIRQGQTRYSYLVLEFIKDEDIDLELGLTEEQIDEQYGGKLEREMSGALYEIVSKLFRVLVNMKITVPGTFIGHSGTPAIQAAHRQNPGLFYPLEKGFLYIHKPPMYVRYEEVSSVHFARSDGGNVTRTFDFEIELKNGQSLLFNSVEKEEYNKLYDYVQNKHLRIRNAKRMDVYAEDKFAGSDDEIDPYKAAVKAEGRIRDDEESDDSDSEDEDYDLDADLKKREKEKESSEGSGSEPDDEYDSGSASDDSGTGESEPDDEVPKKKKREVKEKKPKEEKEGKGKKGKVKKDPNAPKRPSTAFMLWMNQNRSTIKKDGDSVGETAKRAGEMWKTLDSSEKKKWDEKAAEDKARYESEMKEYKKSGSAAAFAASSSSSKPSTSSAKPKKSVGPSPSKAKSKEYISESDDSDDEDEKPKKKEKKTVEPEESEQESEDSDSD